MMYSTFSNILTPCLIGTLGGRGASLDPATSAFVAASGATDAAAIDAWVVQMKAAGLWSFVRAWPMRAGQNAGAGATVYGLGGAE